MLKIPNRVFLPTRPRRGGSDWIPFHGWSVKRGEGSWDERETHCSQLRCWIRRTCHGHTGSTLTAYWRGWRVSLLGSRRKCLLMPGPTVSPWQRRPFVDTCCCWSWIPRRKWPAAWIRRRCRVEMMATTRRCCCTGRRRRFVWFRQAGHWWRGWRWYFGSQSFYEVSAFFNNKWNWLEYQLNVSYKSQQALKLHMIFVWFLSFYHWFKWNYLNQSTLTRNSWIFIQTFCTYAISLVAIHKFITPVPVYEMKSLI